ncbi:PSD1 and planctomycete cytochrome C domain-containing protein [Verrucomicrobia bacterium]|nr:PSD1 and planctomycete cytochrome C domain-containing protein [Verrucomicrobiota bacterium]
MPKAPIKSLYAGKRVLAVICAAFSVMSMCGAANVDFEKEIKPILSKNCFNCHGEEKRKGGLRLSNKRDAFLPGESGESVIIPRHPESSLLMRMVTSKDEDERMPPKGEGLAAPEMELLRTWIQEGAKWPDGDFEKHWSYVKPEKKGVPTVKEKGWPVNEIDYFVLSQLESRGWNPSNEAEKARLIRRASLALTGLPPSIAEVDVFVSDNSADAYEKVVDRLLASRDYGQRWARPWLDLARYADSNGFQADQLRDSWAYRDWVINALNSDMPFDQFTVEQLAGDLLPNATVDQKIATGFHRTVICNVEAGVHPEENRVNQVIDRVNTTGLVFLGSTLECAQCHNHKYDPFSMKDYYQLFSYFNNTPLEVKQTGGVNYDFIGPKMMLPLEGADREKLSGLQAQYDGLKKRKKMVSKASGSQRKEWEEGLVAQLENPLEWKVLEINEISTTGGETVTILNDRSVLVGGSLPGTSVYDLVCSFDSEFTIAGIKIEALSHPDLPGKGPGRGDVKRPNFILSELSVSIEDAGESRPVTLHSAFADYSQKGWEVGKSIDQNRKTGWAIGQKWAVPHWAAYSLKNPGVLKAGSRLRLVLDQNFGRGRTIGRLRVSVMEGDPAGTNLPEGIAAILQKKKRSKKEKSELDAYFASSNPELAKLNVEMELLKKQIDKLQPPTTLVMVEMDRPRETHIMRRGNYLSPGVEVSAGTPAALHESSEDLPKNRLGLAKWLTSTENPLIGRVTVNRWWGELFGQGIVTTVEDFGSQCEPPTHPKLLDWLASEFVEGGWSRKHIHKLMVMSATFRQSSTHKAEMLEHDPANRFFSHGPRFRLTAEAIRDSALKVSGLLSNKMGGPPVMPYQPDGIWRQVGRNEPKWVTAEDERRFRRGIYIVYRRAAPYPSFVNFDAPDRGSCVIKRPRTNTPLQALTLLNDPAHLEMSLALGLRMIQESNSKKLEKVVSYGFRLCLAREPKAEELENLIGVYRSELSRLKKDPSAVRDLITNIPGVKVPESLEPVEAAAWFFVAHVLLNLDETITLG